VTRIRRHPVLAGFALVLLVIVTLVGASAITVWRAAHTDDASVVDRADLFIVVGAAQYNGTPSPVFQGRLVQALRLWHQGKSDLIVTVGSNQPGDTTTEAQAAKDYLVGRGVPASAIVALPVGHSTYDSMQAVAQELHARSLETAFLVSDPWHNARIKAMAGDLGLTGYASATSTSAARSEESRGKGYLRETFAYLYYRIFGR
jgi:uncharacterized SAM-binding protein YcdF (DUF218 family)